MDVSNEAKKLITEAISIAQQTPDKEVAFIITRSLITGELELEHVADGDETSVDFNNHAYLNALRHDNLIFMLHSHPIDNEPTPSELDKQQAQLCLTPWIIIHPEYPSQYYLLKREHYAGSQNIWNNCRILRCEL